MASVTSLSDEDIRLLYDLKTTCFLEGYSCRLPAENVTVTALDQISYFLDEISYWDLSSESADLFKVSKRYCSACLDDPYSSYCYSCDHGYSGADHYVIRKNGEILFQDISIIYYSDVKKEYEARGLNTSTEESDNSLTNIIQSKLDLSDSIESLLIITSSIILLFFVSFILKKFIFFFKE